MMVAQIRRVAQRVTITGITSRCRATDGLQAKKERGVKEDLVVFSLSK